MVAELLKKFPLIYGTRMSIIMFTEIRPPLTPTWAKELYVLGCKAL
jgi:hypothetical protein